jgi:hypothetical protein
MNFSTLTSQRKRSLGLLFLVISLFMATFAFAQPGGGEALKFQNSNYLDHGDFVYFGCQDVLGNATNPSKLTVAAWVKWTVNPQTITTGSHESNESKNSIIIAKARWNSNDNSSSANGQFWLKHNSTNSTFEFSIRNGQNRYTVTGGSPVVDKWYYVVGVYNGELATSGNVRLKLYVNGSLVGSANAGTLTSTVNKNIAVHNSQYDRMCIGRSPSGYRLFTGHIDEVRIWREALSETAIRAQMFMSADISTAANVLRAHYSMSATSNFGRVIDNSGNGFNGEYMTGLVDVHSFTEAPYTVTDGDKNWSVSPQAWSPVTALISMPGDPDQYADFPKSLWTVGGVGSWSGNDPVAGDTMAIASNTSTVITLGDYDPEYNSSGSLYWTGTGQPVIDNLNNYSSDMTWYGIYDPHESNSRTTSYAPIGTGDLNNSNYYNFAAITSSLTSSFPSSLLTVTGTSLPTDASIVFANDSGDVSVISYNVPATTTPPILSRLNRVWRVEVTGSVTANYSFDCHFGYGIRNVFGSWNHLRIIDNPVSTVGFNMASIVTGTYSFTDSILTVSGVTLTPGVHFLSIGSTDSNTPLPVELATFTAKARKTDVVLDWETVSEKNNYGFFVQRALEANPMAWSDLGFVAGNGTTNVRQQYRFVDETLPVGKAYYRLKQMDRDGTISYSDIATVMGSEAPLATSLNAYPNPVRGAATISFVLAKESPVTVTIHDMLGKVAHTMCENRLFQSGAQSLSLNTAGLQPGSYVLQLRTASGTLARPLLIAR